MIRGIVAGKLHRIFGKKKSNEILISFYFSLVQIYIQLLLPRLSL